MSTPELLAKIDQRMLETLALKNYFRYIIMSATGSGKGDAMNNK